MATCFIRLCARREPLQPDTAGLQRLGMKRKRRGCSGDSLSHLCEILSVAPTGLDNTHARISRHCYRARAEIGSEKSEGAESSDSSIADARTS